MPGLGDLPEEILIDLTRYLEGLDVANFSFSCKRLYLTLQSNYLWVQIMKREGIKLDKHVHKYAIELNHHCPEKMSYLLHRRLKRNWQTKKFKTTSIPLHDTSMAGYDEEHLVVMTKLGNVPRKTWNVKVWDISTSGHQQAFVLFNWSTKLNTEFELDLSSVLVAKSCAVLCFRGKGNDIPTELVACDLKADFAELWRNQLHDWGQFDLPKLFGGSIYQFNLVDNKIEVSSVRNYQKVHSVSLVEGMRYPRGDISGDGQHLAIPGKLALNNAPAISVWTLQGATPSQRFLHPNQVLCPYRWFEKSAVCNGLVYGLLNRKCLLIWDAETAECRNNVELTDSAPGDNEPALAFTFLTVSEYLVATIHSMTGNVTLLDKNGNLESQLQPATYQDSSLSRFKVCDVYISEHCLLLRMINFSQPSFKLVGYKLDSGQKLVDCLQPSFVIDLAPVQECVVHDIGVTPTKIVNFAKNEIVFYDFLSLLPQGF